MNKKVFLILVLSVTAIAFAGIPGAGSTQSADDTQINKRDTSPRELTADQQGQSKQDVETTSKIRRAVVGDKSLSTDAHNVKIITIDGMVTLKGPVKSEQEKKTIEEKASQIVGKEKIKNEIDIAPAKAGK